MKPSNRQVNKIVLVDVLFDYLILTLVKLELIKAEPKRRQHMSAVELFNRLMVYKK